MGSHNKTVDEQSASSDREWLIELISNERRRITIRALKGHDCRTPLNAVVNEIVTSEDGYGDGRHNSVRVSLKQNHIPKLVDHDIIQYDEESDTIATASNYSLAVDILDYISYRSAYSEPNDRTEVPITFESGASRSETDSRAFTFSEAASDPETDQKQRFSSSPFSLTLIVLLWAVLLTLLLTLVLSVAVFNVT
ncbi:DUF7344 domain-containing protein [Natronobacterium gregoryi]|uniref:DUF7344 domain-containing protein n=3 Tax=Natronobacterium gregoryi TaxID=44930 RepID=L0AI30_NATGS|nr:hypothetical protein Natgr_1497 [Natronobacterium gregoryi SP2]SFI92083.1 hypothetical protein SAMN05443661_10988 [Natronobacterium gregoryi]